MAPVSCFKFPEEFSVTSLWHHSAHPSYSSMRIAIFILLEDLADLCLIFWYAPVDFAILM